jgi:hypothetical protein
LCWLGSPRGGLRQNSAMTNAQAADCLFQRSLKTPTGWCLAVCSGPRSPPRFPAADGVEFHTRVHRVSQRSALSLQDLGRRQGDRQVCDVFIYWLTWRDSVSTTQACIKYRQRSEDAHTASNLCQCTLDPELEPHPHAYRHCEYQSLMYSHLDPAAHVLQPV